MVLHGEDPALGSTGAFKNEIPVQGLDGEGVQHTDVDLLCESRKHRGVAEGEALGAVGVSLMGEVGGGVPRVVTQLNAWAYPYPGETSCRSVPIIWVVLGSPPSGLPPPSAYL